LVRNLGISTLIFTGIATDLAVESNARESLNRDFYTVIAADAISSFDSESHISSLENLKRIINVIPSKELVNIWSRI
jgi:nicotinamidase-related amidase